MNNIEKKNKIQKQALNKWVEANKCGTTEIITGLGKTFIALHALYTMPRDDSVEHLFLAEVKDRENDLIKEIIKYNKIFDRDVFKDYNLKFYCYQTVYKWKNKNFGLVISDEIHDSLTLSYSKFYKNNNYKAIIGLSATINKSTQYELPNGDIITKGELLNKIAPICFKYTLKEANQDNTTRNIVVNVIKTKLDNKNKYIKAGNAKKRFYQTEVASYKYWDNQFKKALFIEDEELKTKKISISSKKRKDIIYNSIEKINSVRKLVENIDNKIIVFGNSIDSLLKISPNIVSSRNSDEENERIKQDFNNNKLKIIGSFKKLKQGANLDKLDVVIIMSYYGTSLDWIQRIGRLRDNGELGYVYVLLTENTQEEIWFNNMLNGYNNINIIYYNNIEDYLKINKNNGNKS